MENIILDLVVLFILLRKNNSSYLITICFNLLAKNLYNQ